MRTETCGQIQSIVLHELAHRDVTGRKLCHERFHEETVRAHLETDIAGVRSVLCVTCMGTYLEAHQQYAEFYRRNADMLTAPPARVTAADPSPALRESTSAEA